MPYHERHESLCGIFSILHTERRPVMNKLNVHIEVLSDGIWHHFAAPDVETDYILYAVMTGKDKNYLRHGEKIKPVARIHELPLDASPVTKSCLAYSMTHDMDTSSGVHVLESCDLGPLHEHLLAYDQYTYEYWNPEQEFHTRINGLPLFMHTGFDDIRIILWYT